VRALGGRRATMLLLGALATTWLLSGVAASGTPVRDSGPDVH
jgi:hypothetical protein